MEQQTSNVPEQSTQAPPPELAVPMPETPVAAAVHQITMANRAFCADEKSLGRCVSLDKLLQQSEKRIADDHKLKTEGITAAKRAIDTEKRKIVEGIQAARKYVQGLILAYRDQQRREAEEAAAKDREEVQDKAIAEAENLEAQGRHEEAEQVLSEGQELADSAGAAVPTGPVRGDLAGTASFTDVVQFEIENADQVPREFCKPDEAKIREAIRRKENPVTEIPGVRVWTEQKMTNR